MASVNLPPPRLPEPPAQIDRRYMEDLVRTLQTFITQERNPGELRATKITLTDLQDTYDLHYCHHLIHF